MISVHASVQFVHDLIARHAMQAVDVLRDDRFQFALPFELGKETVRRIGFGSRIHHFAEIEIKKQLGLFHQKIM